jgi:hypothetical protein
MKLINVMRKILFILIAMSSVSFLFADENKVLLLPYSATTLTSEQQAMNPTFIAYPTSIKGTIQNDIHFHCNQQIRELGPFSVSPTKKVVFSSGNLQYNAAIGTHLCADGTTQPGTWRFAKHQWDYVGDATYGNVYESGVKCNNELISPTYDDWIDLFAWGTSGWNSGANVYKPCEIRDITDYTDYYPGGNENNELLGAYAYADWGRYNTIQNGSTVDDASIWRTLSGDECEYLFHGRSNAENLFGLGTVNGVQGIIVLPDNWNTPLEVSFISGTESGLSWYTLLYRDNGVSHYSDNVYTIEQWDKMESSGAVFLPAAGYRGQNVIFEASASGHYWSSSTINQDGADCISFQYDRIIPKHGLMRFCGLSIRLVRDIVPPSFSISANAKVVFSPGNLQYQASTNTWRFAEHQWDFVGFETKGTVYENGEKCNNSLIGEGYSGWIDLFAWATSGWNRSTSKVEYSSPTSIDDSRCNRIRYHLNGNGGKGFETGSGYENADWGVYNQIGQYSSGTWRTLSAAQWNYIIDLRANANNLCGLGKVNGVYGLILLPDEWVPLAEISFVPSRDNASINNYSIDDWTLMEKHGAIFLPNAGRRYERNEQSGGGWYWSSSANSNAKDDGANGCNLPQYTYIYYEAYCLVFGSYVNANSSTCRSYGLAVRLVRDIE